MSLFIHVHRGRRVNRCGSSPLGTGGGTCWHSFLESMALFILDFVGSNGPSVLSILLGSTVNQMWVVNLILNK
jgi:hypothetical protein